MEMDVKKEIRRAVDSGRAVFGKRQSEKSILGGKAHLIIVGNNTPPLTKEKIKHLGNVASIPLYEFGGSGIELGAVCGKPFVVSIMAIEDVGKSKILNAVKAE